MSLKGDNNQLKRKYELMNQELEEYKTIMNEKDKELIKFKRKILDLEEIMVVFLLKVYLLIFYNLGRTKKRNRRKKFYYWTKRKSYS